METSKGRTGLGVAIKVFADGSEPIEVECATSALLVRDETGQRGSMEVQTHFCADKGQRMLMRPGVKVGVMIDYSNSGVACIERFEAMVRPVGGISIQRDDIMRRTFLLTPVTMSEFEFTD